MYEVNKIVSLEAMYMTPCIFPYHLTCIKVNSPANKVRNFIEFGHILGRYTDETFQFLSLSSVIDPICIIILIISVAGHFFLDHEADAVD